MLPCKTVKPASKELIAQELSGWVFGEVNSEKCLRPIFLFIESFPQMCFEGSSCRIGYEPTKISRDHFWRSISRDTNVEV